MPMTPLAFIDQYLARYQSHNPALWNYEDGCVLTGCRQLYQATGEEKYLRFVLDYLDARVAADGTIPTFDTGNYNIDAINCGKALFLAWDATGEEKYRKALDFHARRLAGHPRCVCGSFFAFYGALGEHCLFGGFPYLSACELNLVIASRRSVF